MTPSKMRTTCPACGRGPKDKTLSLATTEMLDTLIHCFRGCTPQEIHDAALSGELSRKAEIQRRTQADLAEQKRRTDYIWDRTETITEKLAAHRYLTDRLAVSGKGWQPRHLDFLGRDVRAVRSMSPQKIHDNREFGIRFLPPAWDGSSRKYPNFKPFAVAYGYRHPLSEDPPGLIQVLAIDKAGRRHPAKRWRSALSRGRLADGAVCEALNLGEPGPLVIAEAPVTAIAAAFICGKTIAKPSYAIAAYGASGLAGLDIKGLREALARRDGAEVSGAVVAADGDEAGRRAADAVLAAEPGAKVLVSKEGRDAADDWLEHLRSGTVMWDVWAPG